VKSGEGVLFERGIEDMWGWAFVSHRGGEIGLKNKLDSVSLEGFFQFWRIRSVLEGTATTNGSIIS